MRIFWILLCALMLSAPMSAQVDQGAITGMVQDSSGAAVAGAKVLLTNSETLLEQSTHSDKSGVYVFQPLKIGNYSLVASAPGFENFQQDHIRLDLQGRVSIVLILRPGSPKDTITVTDAPPLLQTEQGSLGETFSAQQIDQTPISGRNWVYMAQLAPGIAPANGSRAQGKGDFNANGQRAEQNNFVLDGIDNNTYVVDFLNGSSYVVKPPPDALAEFKVETSSYSAEYGHSAGAVVSASMKSGTNQLQGSIWEYFRNDALSARDFNALKKPEFRENQFGGAAGFPIWKNKLFLFADAEGNRIIAGQPNTLTVPTALMRQGNFSELLNTGLTGASKPITLYAPNSGGAALLPGNTLAASQIDPVAQKILNLYPLPNTNGGKTFNNYNTNTNNEDNTAQFDTRLDWNADSKDQMFFRFSYASDPSHYPSPLGPILDGNSARPGGITTNLGENGAFSETHIFTPSLINEFRVGYNYGSFSVLQLNSNQNVAASLGLGGIPYGAGYPDNGGLPNVTISGISGFGSRTYRPAVERENVYQIQDNLSKIAGNHSIKVGFSLQSIRVSTLQPQYSHGTYSFTGLYTSNLGASNTGDGVADFLTDQNNSANLSNISSTNDVRWYRSGFAQDDWKVTRRLSLSLGIRYEYFQPTKENSDQQANFFPTGPLSPGSGSASYVIPASASNVPLSPQFLQLLQNNHIALQYIKGSYVTQTQKDNFAPRVGFAYQAIPKTVIRGGFGLFYGGLENEGYNPNLGENYPFQFTDTFPAPSCKAGNCPSDGLTLEQGFSQALSAGLRNFISTPVLRGSDPQIETTYAMNYNLTVERAISSNLVASIAYVGSGSRHLQLYEDQNSATALVSPSTSITKVRPFPGFGASTFTSFAGRAGYQSLQMKIEKRYSSGLQFIANYVYSHARDDASTPLGSGGDPGIRNPLLVPIALDYSNSPWDIRHRLVLNGSYELPFGQGRRYALRSGLLDRLAGGWSLNYTFVAETGEPFSVTPDNATATGGLSYARTVGDPFAAGGTPNSTNPGATCAAKTRTTTNWYNPCAFANPLPGNLIGSAGYPAQITNLSQVLSFLGGKRLQVEGPGYNRSNLSLRKNFNFFGEHQLQFTTEIFNLFNTPSFGLPSTTTDSSSGGAITTSRSPQLYTPDARFIEFSLKYRF